MWHWFWVSKYVLFSLYELTDFIFVNCCFPTCLALRQSYFHMVLKLESYVCVVGLVFDFVLSISILAPFSSSIISKRLGCKFKRGYIHFKET